MEYQEDTENVHTVANDNHHSLRKDAALPTDEGQQPSRKRRRSKELEEEEQHEEEQAQHEEEEEEEDEEDEEHEDATFADLTDPAASQNSAILYCRNIYNLKQLWERYKKAAPAVQTPTSTPTATPTSTNWLSDLEIEILLPRSGVEDVRDSRKKLKRKPIKDLSQQYKPVRKIAEIIDQVCKRENGETFRELVRKLPEEKKVQEEMWRKMVIEHERKKQIKNEQEQQAQSQQQQQQQPQEQEQMVSPSMHQPMPNMVSPQVQAMLQTQPGNIQQMLQGQAPVLDPSYQVSSGVHGYGGYDPSFSPSVVASPHPILPILGAKNSPVPTSTTSTAPSQVMPMSPVKPASPFASVEEASAPGSTPRKRRKLQDAHVLPSDMKSEWGFTPDEAKKAYLQVLEDEKKEGKKVCYRWRRIGQKIGNSRFNDLPRVGERIQYILRYYFPQLLPPKNREVSSNPKEEWGFDADDIKALIEADDANPDPHKEKLSMRKIGEKLGNKHRLHPEKKPFAERDDRNQLVHSLLKKKYPELAKRFERKSTVKRSRKKKPLFQTPSGVTIDRPLTESDHMSEGVEDEGEDSVSSSPPSAYAESQDQLNSVTPALQPALIEAQGIATSTSPSSQTHQ